MQDTGSPSELYKFYYHDLVSDHVIVFQESWVSDLADFLALQLVQYDYWQPGSVSICDRADDQDDRYERS